MDEQEEKARLIAQVMELQNTLDGINDCRVYEFFFNAYTYFSPILFRSFTACGQC